MSNLAIRVEGLSKRYQLGTIGYGSLQHDLMGWWAKVRGKEDPNTKIGEKSRLDLHGEFWALRDVNFEVNQGDRVGIIGRNGAGKSTLLKLLSRVTSPTTGSIKGRGRIASLLEVGTGFHPELTGRENIFLNGAILGMKRREIQSRFDEIVGFAGVDQFIDTPVKRYSSGMYVRLAFSVAAHLDSEILIIDEVLAVGDADFQKKCIDKMQDLSKNHGKTILFVSHQMNIVSAFCNKGMLLEKGRVSKPLSDIRETLISYSGTDKSVHGVWRAEVGEVSRPSIMEPIYLAVSRTAESPIATAAFFTASDELQVTVGVQINEMNPLLTFGIAVSQEGGPMLFWSNVTDQKRDEWPAQKLGYNEYSTTLPAHFLNEGVYRLELMSSVHFQYWINEPQSNCPSISFRVQGDLSESEYWREARPGILAPILRWKTHGSH